MGSNYKIVEGSEIQGNSLRLPRAISIYKAAKRHEQVGIISCKRKSDLSEVIIIRLSHLNIPDLPDFPIQPCEDVAIRCLKEDLDIPEVYAIRKDFPTGLPHSNIRQYERPVSLCVSDVYFSDIRPQFNAFDFINSIIRWFNLNSIGELHEKDRPLEVFFQYHDFCGMVNSFSSIAPYGVYNKKTEHTSTLEFVDKAKANSDICLVVLKSIVSKNLAFLPKNIGELNTLETIDGKTIIETIIDFARKTDRKSERSLLLMLAIQQKNATPTSEDKIDLAKDPVKEVVEVGTKKAAAAPNGKNAKRVIVMQATAYDPSAGSKTAMGTRARVGAVAVDPRVIPLGSKLYIESMDGFASYGYATAEDTGGAIKGNRIDLFYNSNAEANRFGRRNVKVYVLD